MSENQKKYHLIGSVADGTVRPEKGYQPTLWERMANHNKRFDLPDWLEGWFNYIPMDFPLSEAADPDIPQYNKKINIGDVLTAKTLQNLYGKLLWVIAATGSGKTQWILDVVLPLGPVLYVSHRTLATRQFKQRVIEKVKGKEAAASLSPEMLDYFFTPATSKVFPGYDLIAMSYQKLSECFELNNPPAEKIDIIIVDEIHSLWSEGSFNYKTSNVIDGIMKCYPNALIILMTATPQVALGNCMDWLYKQNFQKETYCYNFYQKPDTNSIAHFFKSQDELVEIIHSAPSEEKFLIFVESIVDGHQLQHKLSKTLGNENVEFLYADNMRDGTQEDLVQDIVNEACFYKRVLIATPVIDAAVSLIDDKLRSLVFYSCEPVRIKQEKGRKRDTFPNERLNLYFYIPTAKELSAAAVGTKKKLSEAWKAISRIKNGTVVPIDRLPFPIHVGWDHQKKDLAFRYNRFTLDQWLWEVRQYEEAGDALRESGDEGYAELLLQKLNIADRSWLTNNKISLNDKITSCREEVQKKLDTEKNHPKTTKEGNDFLMWVSDKIQDIPESAYSEAGLHKGNKGDGASPQGFKKLMRVLELEYTLEHQTQKQHGKESWIIRQGKGGK